MVQKLGANFLHPPLPPFYFYFVFILLCFGIFNICFYLINISEGTHTSKRVSGQQNNLIAAEERAQLSKNKVSRLDTREGFYGKYGPVSMEG